MNPLTQTIHTEEDLFSERVKNNVLTYRETEYGTEARIDAKSIMAANKTQIQRILQAVVVEIEGMKKSDDREGIYCGCDGECFGRCASSFNAALSNLKTTLIEVIGN